MRLAKRSRDPVRRRVSPRGCLKLAAGKVAGRTGGVQPALAAHMAALVVAQDVSDVAAIAGQVAEDSADPRVAEPFRLGQTFVLRCHVRRAARTRTSSLVGP